jgi:hypothetical protein
MCRGTTELPRGQTTAAKGENIFNCNHNLPRRYKLLIGKESHLIVALRIRARI